MPDKGMGLPDERPSRKTDARWKLFAREYIKDLNGTRAYIAAGYSKRGADAGASRLLGNIKVRKLVEELAEKRNKKLDLTAEQVLAELKLMGFSNMLDYIRIQGGNAYIDLSKLSREQAAAIQEITVDEYTEGRGDDARDVKRIRFKLADKRGSLELLGKHLRLFAEKHEVSGGDPIRVIVEYIGEPANTTTTKAS